MRSNNFIRIFQKRRKNPTKHNTNRMRKAEEPWMDGSWINNAGLYQCTMTSELGKSIVKSLSATLPTPWYIKLLFQNVNRLETVT